MVVGPVTGRKYKRSTIRNAMIIGGGIVALLVLMFGGKFTVQNISEPFLLNPEGFRHSPFSAGGCTIFVKLRQFPGLDRRHIVLNTDEFAWEPTTMPAVARKALYQQDGFSDIMHLERWEPEANLGVISYEQGAEVFVLTGEFFDEVDTYSAGSWLRLPAGATHHPRSTGGCTLYVKRSGLPYLRLPAV